MKSEPRKKINLIRRTKRDELFTPYEMIAEELPFYKELFKDKVVLCNCNDSEDSNFFKYFVDHFDDYELKSLICTTYIRKGKAEKLVYSKSGLDKDQLSGNGDFCSKECQKLIDQADIIVTAPPFYLFEKYLELLTDKDKKFLILGNTKSLLNGKLFDLVQNNKISFGKNVHPETFKFYTKQNIPQSARNCGYDEFGNRFIQAENVRWITNLNTDQSEKVLHLTARYSPDKYPMFDTYQAIKVNKTAEIPVDYDGVMAVPLTYLDKHDPSKFEIVGMLSNDKDALAEPVINGKYVYKRIVIKNKIPILS